MTRGLKWENIMPKPMRSTERNLDVIGRSYGQRLPPLTSILKSILERYPDGGQILKEIIQNADDASATKVSFLLDSRHSAHGKSSLYNPDLAKFQGPALYSFNNALFKEEDWDGLQSLMDSNKKEDPLKVGRFGIGFNSIYHVTDLPSIVSGKLLAFLDPHEAYFGPRETGKQFDLHEPLLRDYYDQFSPYEDVLGCKISGQLVNGTLFRFPLRTETSELSQKVYTTDKVQSLFQSLKDEASLILLFLKNIEEISLYETNENQKEILVFRIRLHDGCREEVCKQRQDLLRRVPEWENGRQAVLQLNLVMTIEIFDKNLGTRQEKWITHNRIGDKQSKLRQKALALHLLPWVGFAAPLTVDGGRSIGSNGGRIFCFLPLPPDADARTGYPVHIHGYFGLTDNRRGLKWPGPECQNDDMAEWNEHLMKFVGCQAYASLIQAMTNCLPIPQDMVNIFYQCWPNIQHVNKHWKDIIDSVFSLLLSMRVFWTDSNGWLSLNQVVIERLHRGNLPAYTKEVVKKVLRLANEPVVTLPSHVDDYVGRNATNTRTVTPRYLRAILKKGKQGSWSMAKMDKREKIAVLQYIITDNNFADFEGIALLPLADGRFTTFKAGSRCGPDDIIYVETPDNRRSLLPGMESRFLDANGSCLVRIAADQNNYRHSSLQLVRLNPQTVVSLIWKILPKEILHPSVDPVVWDLSSGKHPSEAWLAAIWNWLRQTFPNNLSQLEGMPIIKCKLGQQTALAKLRRNTKTIRQQGYQTNTSLPDGVVSLVQKAGVVVLSEVPGYMTQHPCCSTYVTDASPEGLLKVLRNIGPQRTMAAVMASNAQQRRSLRAFLSLLRANLSGDENQFLKSLPIFEAIDQTSFINAQNKTSTAPRGFATQISLEIKNAITILSVEENSSNQLLKILSVPEMTMAQFLTREIFPHLNTFYTIGQITDLMCWVLQRIAVFRNESPDFCTFISSLKFVDAGDGTLLRPQDLFDPRIKLNQRLFEGEKLRFPSGEYESDDILVALCSLGLKKVPEANDLATLASNLHSFNDHQKRRKGMALLDFLGENPYLLTGNVNDLSLGTNTLQDFLRTVAWVPCADHPPPLYPKCMPWNSVGCQLLRPEEALPSEYGVIVGAVMSVLQSEPTSHIKKVFGWDKAPDASKVTEQLKIACHVDVKLLQGIEREHFWRMLKSIYESLANTSDYHVYLCHVDFAWIWNGEGFSSPSKIAFERQTNFDLEPYLYKIPDEMQGREFRVFFSTFAVKAGFSEDDLLKVLHEIKVKHDNLKLDRRVVDKDRQLTLDILRWIVRDGPLDGQLRDRVFVPVMKDPDTLKLVPLTECTFCDAAWLRGNFVELQLLPELSELSLIDESISNTTASHLGVPPMSKWVTSPESLGFEQAGPYEPITTRLRNILDEYKEGAGVFKELIQNADDAGATEVKFVVDWRQHPQTKLLAEGMKETQGPALLAYNNAVFTEKDFENINKLAGATKKEDLDKIGRFGLGFNSVYHLTDTPCFVSSEFAVFFDPDTKHLGHLIRDPLRPGVKLNLALKRNTLLCYPDQFKPFHGFFNCDVNGETPFNFDGTLFRFPFRIKPSDICDKQYKNADVNALFESLNTTASTLLLNTQNVQHVSVWELDQHAHEPSDMELLVEVERNILSESGGLKNTTFLQDCAEWSNNENSISLLDLPQRSKIISTTHTTTKDELRPKTEYWLQCDRLGDGESLEMAKSEEGRTKGLLSCAGVAVNLQRAEVQDRDCWKNKKTHGEAFCFLPLSIQTGLPVHVNGYFAVTSNRRGIWEQTTEEDQRFQPVEARWNKALMKDGIAQAYLELLKKAKQMAEKGNLQEYHFCSLWPNPDCLQSQVWKPLILSVYELIGKSTFPLMKSRGKWLTVTDCIFLDDDMKNIPASLEILHGTNIVDLPKFARNGFHHAGCGSEIEKRTLSQETFLIEVFFPNIKNISFPLRNKVVCYVIDGCLSSSSDSKIPKLFQHLLSSYACIPCSEDQQVLAYPKDLISPDGAAASLYSSSDNKMPVGDCFLEPKRLLVLKNLGMVSDVLNWDQVLDRAKSVERFSDGLQRISNLVKYLNNFIDQMPALPDKISKELASLPVLPVKPKPEEYLLPWKGEDFDEQTMLPSAELFCQEYTNLIGTLKPVLDECEQTGCGILNMKVRRVFSLSDNKPSFKDAIEQLQIVCGIFQKSQIGRQSLQHISKLCSDIYDFLHAFVGKEEETSLKERLHGLPWILVEDRFVKSNQLAFTWSGNGAPYLYRVPKCLANSQLLSAVGVKMKFDEKDFISALNELEKTNKGKMLGDFEFKLSKVFLDELNSVEIPKHDLGGIPMPDQDRVLRPSQELAINDAPWIVMGKDVKYVHEDISINLAHVLGARDIRSKNIEDISRPLGKPFGQKELLTDRLAGILKSYPCDFGILKELLQNADDAKATEIHFIYDPRRHGTKHVFSDSWRELQGPALCVYNDRPFSEKDLEGIQRLGIGSKADDPEKTGQYGIGFNAVYHLTDCPSFITDEDTLCILDPHARYMRGATKENPGRIIDSFKEDHNFEENYRDALSGYLGNLFDLRGSTMFRFPLRTREMARKSRISKEVIEKMELLLYWFQMEAKETLLFLNHVKKISVSTIRENQLILNYEVSAHLESEDEQKRRELAVEIERSKHSATHEIRRYEVTYPVKLKENHTEEKWIVQQTLGVDSKNPEIKIPDGKQNGLLPRAGVAAKVTTKNAHKELSHVTKPEKRKAFCFLPLPVFTGLPVHVNGHFALDSGRRHLWQDEDGSGFRSKWNKFLKTEVIADAYVSLLIEARRHIPHLHGDKERQYFSTVHKSYLGLDWYQRLFPSKGEAETQWEILVVAVLNKIALEDVPLFPVVRTGSAVKGKNHPCSWLSSSNGYFTNPECNVDLEGILRSIGFNLISLLHQIYKDFKEVDAPVVTVTPEDVMTFLSTSKPFLRQLPCLIEHSSIGTLTRYLEVLFYCMESTAFTERLDGVPLLLTKDRFLRPFSKQKPVYLSLFSHLVPSPGHFKLFAHEALTKALKSRCNDLFKQQTPVLLPLTLPKLAEFLPFIFKAQKPWNKTCIPVLWDPDEDDQELSKWLIELWSFISMEYQKTPSDRFLEPLTSWPILPITSRHLVPVSLSKTILDLTQQDSWTKTQTKLVEVLRKLKCPEVDMRRIGGSQAKLVSDVVRSYLAYPNSIDDVVIVLDNLMQRDGDISGRILAKDAELLLQFLQEDRETLEANVKSATILRKLPFYKTIDGRLIKLDGVFAVCKVPVGIPMEESQVWMKDTGHVFLEPCHTLDMIHEILGVQLKSQTSCYIDFIFPKFSKLSPSTRMKHLSYIRDRLLHDPSNKQSTQLHSALESLAFIPNDRTGILCKASDLYDPMNPVFQVLLTHDEFPGGPFSTLEWIQFLYEIGLRQTLSKTQVMEFAKEIESVAISLEITTQLLERSRVLTTYLLQETSLHEPHFLQTISSIKFVVPHEVDKKLTLVVPQFHCGCLTCFRNAVPQEHEVIVWSTASLLSTWSVPYDKHLCNQLGILQEPTLPQVVKHANNICQTFSKKRDMDLESSLRELLLKVMEEIYKYLQRECPAFDDLSLQLLRAMPLALVENGGIFIQCKQLAFEMQDFQEQPPYLYRVPRNYGIFEGLFKMLGAAEKPMPSQYVYILEEIWKSCKEKKMHAEEIRIAKRATAGFFRALKRLNDEDHRAKTKTTKCADSLKDVNIIHFPTQSGKLRPSNQLFHMYDCPQMLERVEALTSRYELMIELADCGLRYDRPEELLSYLPQHLRVNSITQIMKEELHPECLDKKCRLDKDGECQEANRLREILESHHFTEGLVRIFKAQEQKAPLTEDLIKKIENLRTMFTIICFETLETVMKNMDDEQIESSKKEKSFFVKNDGTTLVIFIRHGIRNLLQIVKLCEFIYKYLDGALNSMYFLHVQNMLRLKEAAKIPHLLDENGIRRDVQQLSASRYEIKPGTIIPPELHYLLMMYEEFLFRPDEIVGYEIEDNLEGEQGKYIYARIIEKISAPSHGYKEKKKKSKKKELKKKRATTRMKYQSDSSTGSEQRENPLLGRYLIDIGTDTPIEADVLDLYKIKRPPALDDTPAEEDAFIWDPSVPYEGDAEPTITYNSAKPSTWDEIVKEIRQALADIMKLPEDKRRKAIKRLYLRWHPDKNPKEMEELANEAIKFIQAEFKRLSTGGGSTDNPTGAGSGCPFGGRWGTFFTNCDQRARQQRSTYENYQRQRRSYRSRSRHGTTFSQGSEFHDPDASMARIWIIQSRADLRSVEHLFDANDGLNWLICFQCSQVVEKALKAALYASRGLTEDQLMSHDLIWLASELRSAPNGPDVLYLSGELRNYHIPTRYPNKRGPCRPPKDVFTLGQAQIAYEIAKEVLQKLEEFIGILQI